MRQLKTIETDPIKIFGNNHAIKMTHPANIKDSIETIKSSA